jgi:hypothetical protein
MPADPTPSAPYADLRWLRQEFGRISSYWMSFAQADALWSMMSARLGAPKPTRADGVGAGGTGVIERQDLAALRADLARVTAERDEARAALVKATADPQTISWQTMKSLWGESKAEVKRLRSILQDIIDVGVGYTGVDMGRGGDDCRYCEEKNELARAALGADPDGAPKGEA